jgi:hypothetical protein
VIASTADATALSGSIGGGFELSVRPSAKGIFDAWFGRHGPRALTNGDGAVGTLGIDLKRGARGPLVVGDEPGPRVRAERLALTSKLAFSTGAPPSFEFGIDLEDVAFELLPDWLRAFAGNTFCPQVQKLALKVDPVGGLRFGEGGLRIVLPVTTDLQGVRVDGVGVELTGSDAGLRFGVDLTLELAQAGMPLSIRVEGLGANFPLSLDDKVPVGFSGIGFQEPRGVSGALTLPMASGGGALVKNADDSFGGCFQLNLSFVTVQAIALLRSKSAESISFAALMSVSFPYPGIQLGFGFSLLGVGGIVGINHRLDPRALEEIVLDGSVNQLLFPVQPERDPLQAIRTMERIFPRDPGHFVVGPMVQLAWGGRMVTLAVAVIFDLPDRPTFTLLGRLTLALPDPAAPIVFLQATFRGNFDPTVPATSLLATLCGSRIAGLPLNGDLLMLARGGADATLILSAGGFHPAYVRPPGVPQLRRIGMDFSPLPLLRMRAEAYFTFTATSVQFGAGLQLSASIAKCGVEGFFNIDALCETRPEFSLLATCNGSVAVEVFGKTLLAVGMSLTVTGPTPWRVRGTGSVSLFIADISLNFDESWGARSEAQLTAPDVEGELRHAFEEVSAWVAELPEAERRVGILKDARGVEANLVHPSTLLKARQRVLPFDLPLVRYQGIPIPAQLWHIAGGGLRDAPEAQLGEFVTDLFAGAQYFDLSDQEQLAGRAFERMPCGVELRLDELELGSAQKVEEEYDTSLIVAEEDRRTPRRHAWQLSMKRGAEMLSLGSRDALREAVWWKPRQGLEIQVKQAQPLTLAASDSLKALLTDEVPNYASARELLKKVNRTANFAQIVERWELP